ncbi:MAG: acetate kinase [Oscillospiraceae bacterium]|nr:acetate kinase [Oscillospiraceae bacterium]
MRILVINAGSSSIKYQLFDMNDESIIAKGQCERIGIEGSNVKQNSDKGEIIFKEAIANHTEAMQYIIKALTDAEKGVIASMSEIDAVGHRVLHGGASFTASQIINPTVMDAIRENIILGPLHNPANIAGIEACEAMMPGTPNVAVFDTAFHQTMPDYAFMYAVPYDYYTRLKVRKYGFHGTSHRFVSKRAAQMLGSETGEGLKIIVCHMGNGSSLSAVKDGKCCDTSMGITPLEGMVMGTRSGDLDAATLQYIMKNDGIDIEEMTNILNKKSGLLGVSGVSSDMRDLTAAAEAGNERAQLAHKMLTYRLKKYIGSYAAAMGGVDAIVFTGGIGENDNLVRKAAVEGLEYMGVKLDYAKNDVTRNDGFIQAEDSKVKIMVVKTNEELAIARDTLELCK